MSRIKILDEMTAGQIAAGEVVERPVSVVKELVENSLDAGADQIFLDISDGGKAEITVYDNGCGMSQEEVSLAFCRHATSKIICAQDLYSLTTLGFRGEALPSIAAVSHLVLKSKVHGESVGHRIEVKGGEILSLQPIGSPSGTLVRVSELFYNTPARRKHLKSKGTETGLIANMLQNICLARPEVRFLLKHNNKVVFRSPGSAKLVDALCAIYGVDNVREMLEIDAEHSGVSFTGYISKPSVTRRKRSYITVVINGRYVKSKLILDAVDAAYKGLIPSGRHPIAVLALNINPGSLDVNIHPAKMEIRIDNGIEISKFIEYTIRERLKNAVLIPSYEMRPQNNEPAIVLHEAQRVTSSLDSENGQEKHYDKIKRLTSVANKEYYQDSFNYSSKDKDGQGLCQQVAYLKEMSDDFNLKKNNAISPNKEQNQYNEKKNIDNKTNFPFLQVIGQLLPTYIMTAGPDGLYILDQHAAHERILYEEFLSMFHNGKNQTQMLLTPVSLELNYKNLGILQEKINVFKALGFVLEEFGSGSYVLRGIPAHLSTGDGVSQFIDLIDDLYAMEQGEDFSRAFITRLACRAAIKSGEVMSLKAMEAVIEQLSCTAEPYTCPHGRPTLVKITKQELAHMFKRQ